MNRELNERQVRSIMTDYKTREDGEDLIIEGHFAVFNSIYEIAPGMTESVAEGAFDDQTERDVRALTDHDTQMVLGRTKAGTLELRQDEVGLWGRIAINPKDSDAVNTYERVKRGDVDQCSFGFDIVDEEAEYRDDGSVHWTIKQVKLYEVSVCTFPAYSDTHVTARSKERDDMNARKAEAWKKRMEEKLNGVKSTHASEEN